MQFLKISCTNCSHYTKCSQKTRFFVNYCGADRKRYEDQIRRAENECVNRKGFVFRRGQNSFIMSKALP